MFSDDENNSQELRGGSFFSFLRWGETVHLVSRQLTNLLYQPRMIDDECGGIGGMRIDGKPNY
jgi:hypothetical protein